MDSAAQGPRRSTRNKKQTTLGEKMTKALEAVAAKRAARAEKAASKMNNGPKPKRYSVKAKRGVSHVPAVSQTRRVSRKKLPRGSLSAFLSRQRNHQEAYRRAKRSLVPNAQGEAVSRKANASAASGASSRRRGPRPAIVKLTLAEYKHLKEIGELPVRFKVYMSNGKTINKADNANAAERYRLNGIREESSENENRTPSREGESR